MTGFRILNRAVPALAAAIFLAAAVLAGVTVTSLAPLPESLSEVGGQDRKPALLDRSGIPLTVTYTHAWNGSDLLRLHEIPGFLKTCVIASEDKRFYSHSGPDWIARIHALWQNILAMRAVRGASTITEQVVRMLHPRPRTVWSRWLEGFEASRLEKTCPKSEILEFYLNQVPFAANRRGVAQAARYYFDRDLSTLNVRETLALAVLIRSPSGYDLFRRPNGIDRSLERLAQSLMRNGDLSLEAAGTALGTTFDLNRPTLPVAAPHFAGYVYAMSELRGPAPAPSVRTSLDSRLQHTVQGLLDHALVSLAGSGVRNGAALVVDHTSGEILAWTVGCPGSTPDAPGSAVNAVTVPRQPGSSLKPFLYALALEGGWTAATRIDDAPLAEKVGAGGLHTYHNYSRRHYGSVTLRQALGNSLNIPAVRTLQFVGVDTFLERLCQCGITSLDRHPDFYGDGLALGNGEVSLLELVQAYAVLANQGRRVTLSPLPGGRDLGQVFSPEVASLIANILADPNARVLEFGSGSLLSFPVETAVKTGTSSDYRDAWALGFSRHFTAGVWMGNLDGSPMLGITGSRGPAMVLRSIFSTLFERRPTRPLYLSPKLEAREIRTASMERARPIPEDGGPALRTEWFLPGTGPEPRVFSRPDEGFGFIRPVNGLKLAMDPRIPDRSEAVEFRVAGTRPGDDVDWFLDGALLAGCRGPACEWLLTPGDHRLTAICKPAGDTRALSDTVVFSVLRSPL